jgi:chromosome segregation ATPase
MVVSGRRKILLTNEKEFEERLRLVCDQMEALKKQTQKGKISKSVSMKLKKELEIEIEKIEKELVEKLKKESTEIEEELKIMRDSTSELELKQKELATQIEELEARFRIKRISRREYNNQKKNLEQQIEQLAKEISLNGKRIEKLDSRLKYVRDNLVTK